MGGGGYYCLTHQIWWLTCKRTVANPGNCFVFNARESFPKPPTIQEVFGSK